MSKLIVVLLAIFSLFLTQNSIASTYAQRLCNSDDVSCITVKRGDTWDSLWPNNVDRENAMRINRVNTYLHPGMELVVPDNAGKAAALNRLPFSHNIGEQNQRTIILSRSSLAWAAYDEDGKFVRWGPISAGKGFCPDIGGRCITPLGSYTIYRKEGDDCISTKFPIPDGGAPMPYCMFFKGGFALHGGILPGYNASHGCVRMLKGDAEWLNQDFITVGDTKVIIRE